MSSKILIFALFVFAFNISAQKINSKKTDLNPATQNNQLTDELQKHIGAAETFQISGDLNNAAVENRTILGIALQRVGNIAVEEGKYDDAIRLLTESLTYTDNAPNRTNLAMAYQRANEVDRAISEAQKALSTDPDLYNAHYILGNLYFTKEDYRSALPELEKAFRSSPDFELANALGLTYLYLKQPERTKLLFDEIQISMGKDNPDLRLVFAQAYERTNYPLEAEREIRRALAIDPKHPKAQFYLGYLILQQGGSDRLAEAGAAFEEELKLTPDDFFCNFFVGVVASSMNDHAKAIRYLQKAAQIDPLRGESYLFLAQSQVETNDLAGAEKSFRQAIILEGGKPEKDYQARRTHFMFGRLLIKTGRKEEGEKELDIARQLQERSIQSSKDEISQILGKVAADSNHKAENTGISTSAKISLTPERTAELTKIKAYLRDVLAQAFHNLAVISVQTKQLTDALEKFASASKWNPDFAGLDRNWGIVSFQANQFDKAILPLSRHLKANPQDKVIREMLGTSYYFNQDYADAVSTLKPIETSLAGNAELAYFYGISLIQLKRNQEAVLVFNNIALLSQKSPESLFYAGQGFMILGDYARAIKELRTVVALSPNTSKANYFIGQSFIHLNKYDEAEKAFSKELELSPTDFLSKYHLALTFIERKIEPEKTIALLEDAIRLKFDYADPRYQLGKIYLEKGDTNQAIEQLEIAAASEANKDYIHYQLSIAYRKAARKDEADRELRKYQELKAASRKAGSPMANDAKSPN
ncbi:MAG: tetratricopeptide repeat protein [Acidobacteriota bacterium]